MMPFRADTETPSVTVKTGQRFYLPFAQSCLRRDLRSCPVSAVRRMTKTVTDVHIDGIDSVWVIHSDGTQHRWTEQLADSDADLIALVQYFATKEGRAFDRATHG